MNKYKKIIKSLDLVNKIGSIPLHEGEITGISRKDCPMCGMDYCPIYVDNTSIIYFMLMKAKPEEMPFELTTNIKEIYIDYFDANEWVVSLFVKEMLVSECFPLKNHKRHDGGGTGMQRRYFQSPELMELSADKQFQMNSIVQGMLRKYMPAYKQSLYDHDIYFTDHRPAGIQDILKHYEQI